MEKEHLLKCYELHINEDLKNFEIYRSQVKFFSGLIGIFIAILGTGLAKLPTEYHFVLLVASSFLVIVISEYSIKATSTGYQRWLETITVRAKFEYLLGFTKKLSSTDEGNDFKWKNETIIPNRHIRDRNDYKTSEEFVDERKKMGSHLWVIRMFRIFQTLGIALILNAIYVAVKAV